MFEQRRNLALGLLVGAALVYTLVVYGRLPDPMPIHWNFRGEADGWASRPWAFFGVGMMVATAAVLLLLPRLTPKRYSMESFAETYNALVVLVVGLLGTLHALALRAALDSGFDLIRSFTVAGVLSIAAMGTQMSRLKQNPWAGIRTPWTLASEANWNATHRFAAVTMTGGGLAAAVLVAAGASPWLGLVVGIGAVLLPVWKSYVLSRADAGLG